MTKHITLIVTGSIAAVKTFDLLKRLKAQGVTADVVLTHSAQTWITESAVYEINETHPLLLNKLDTNGRLKNFLDKSDMVLIAPATANIIYQLNNEVGYLHSSLKESDKQVVIAPAMNEYMWKHPAVQENVRSLLKKGTKFLGPVNGKMACGDSGYGRFMDTTHIVEALTDKSQDFRFNEVHQALIPDPKLPTENTHKEAKGKNILLVVQGGRDVLQSYELISALKRKGYSVQCAVSKDAEQLVPKHGLATISNRKTISEHYEDDIEGMEHIRLAENADLVLIAPASNKFTAEMAQGGASNFVNCIYLASKAPVVLYPSNDQKHTPKQADIHKLKSHGVTIIDGKLPPDLLANAVDEIFQGKTKGKQL